jgi:hypothetical protein
MKQVYCIAVQYQVFYWLFLFLIKNLTADTFIHMIIKELIGTYNFLKKLIKKVTYCIYC